MSAEHAVKDGLGLGFRATWFELAPYHMEATSMDRWPLSYKRKSRQTGHTAIPPKKSCMHYLRDPGSHSVFSRYDQMRLGHAMKRDHSHLLTMSLHFFAALGLFAPVFRSNMNTMTILIFKIPPSVSVCYSVTYTLTFPLVQCF